MDGSGGGSSANRSNMINLAVETVSKMIDDKKFEVLLDRFLPRPPNLGVPVRKRLRDAEFRQLAEVCNGAGHPLWGLRPRTFAVLRMIGFPEAIENFIAERLTDISLPYNEGNLPSFLNGQMRLHFLDCQHYVLNGRAAALEKAGEPHQHVEGSADEYFHYLKDLGAGGFGEVDSVIGEMSLKNFARKRIKRHRLYSKDKASLQVFENELQTLKKLSHQHLVQLVGSYTDSSCVGLIMTPVADMNLATYLKESTDAESRKICLRRFFGCLVTALSYLHGQHVQHKDIKPANILVKQQNIYLTDFGTSRSWDSETSKTTEGTVTAFTPRYCAPEVVQFNSTRNESRDVWSLGCVFFEMCSVLADHTVEDMYGFFMSNGTRGEFIRENPTAVTAWSDKLKKDFQLQHDQQPLDLAVRMCASEPSKRPMVQEILSRIFDFTGPPRYYGLCCDEQSYFNDHLSDQPPQINSSHNQISATSPGNGLDRCTDHHGKASTTTKRAKYQPPKVDDPSEELTALAVFPPGGSAKKYLLERIEEPDKDAVALISGNLKMDLQRLNPNQLPCPWPKCVWTETSQAQDRLPIHLRESHGTHELFWTPLIIKNISRTMRQAAEVVLPGQIISDAPPPVQSESGAFILRRDVGFSGSTSDKFATNLRLKCDEVKLDLKKRKNAPEYSPSMVELHVKHDPKRTEMTRSEDEPFSLLPKDRRPARLETYSEDFDAINDENFIRPEPIPEPYFIPRVQGSEASQVVTIPKSTVVPSYILAMSNALTTIRIRTLRSRRAPPPLFVYGSLMFPSILRAVAAKYVSKEGVYCKRLQRRLRTSEEDWSNINSSIQYAAQQMTPAFLDNYQRFEDQRDGDAQLFRTQKLRQDTSNLSNMPSEARKSFNTKVKGFIVFGLSHEALLCLDHMIKHQDQPDNRREPPDDGTTGTERDVKTHTKLGTEYVDVTICTSDADRRVVEATTYVSHAQVHDSQSPLKAWDLEKFVRRNLRKLSTSDYDHRQAGSDWVSEERRLAFRIGTKYAMLGDDLCKMVLNNDMDGVKHLKTLEWDVNAPCHRYGTPLQAAASKGNASAVLFMLKEMHANPNLQGGKYHSPLIAAISGGHDVVVKMLLDFNANPLAKEGPFISPIYYAVSFHDEDMVRLLLEKGAWLSKDYQELLDVASESGNEDLCRLLNLYDIRNLHIQKGLQRPRRRGLLQNTGTAASSKSISLSSIMLLMSDVWSLKGQKGKWTGIKAIKLLRKLYGDNVPAGLLNALGEDFVIGGIRQLLNPDRFSEIVINYGSRPDEQLRLRAATFSNFRHTIQSAPEAIERCDSREEFGDGVTCATCEGRGGRKGTGRSCTACLGGGSIEVRPRSGAPREILLKKCRECSGSGTIFSARDRCQVCNGGSWGFEDHADIVEKECKRRDWESKAGTRTAEPPSLNLKRQIMGHQARRSQNSDPPPPYPGHS